MSEKVRWLDRRASYEHLLPQLTKAQLLVLVTMERFANNASSCAWPSRRTIAEKCGVSEKTVTRSLAKLVELGILKVAREATVTEPTRYFVGPRAVPGSIRNVPPQGTQLCPLPGDIQMSHQEIREEISARDQDHQDPVPVRNPEPERRRSPMDLLLHIARAKVVGGRLR